MSTGYTRPSSSNLPFLISDIRALWRSALSARVPECQKLKMVGYYPDKNIRLEVNPAPSRYGRNHAPSFLTVYYFTC